MGYERTDNNFGNIEAIRALANGMNPDAAPRQEAIDPATTALIAEVEEFEIDLQNPSSNRADEAARMLDRPDIARLSQGALTAIRNNIAIAEEREENSFNTTARSDVWNEQREQTEKDRKERNTGAQLADDLQDIQQQQEQQRQQRAEAWRNETHDYAGQRMTGAEWMQLIQWFRTPENRAEWEDAMMAETGHTRDQVRATGSRMDRYFELMEKRARGEALEPDEQTEFNRLDRDPEIRRGVTTMQNLQANRLDIAASAEVPLSANIEGDLRNGSSATIANSRLGVYDDVPVVAAGRTTSVAAEIDRPASPQPSLVANFNAQASGAPIAPPPHVEIRPAPQLANASVQVDAGNMFG